MLKVYLIGVLITLALVLLTEHLYLGAGRASSISRKDITEDLLISLLSWIGVLLVGVFYLGEYLAGFNTYGYNKDLEDFEEEIKQLSERDHMNDNDPSIPS